MTIDRSQEKLLGAPAYDPNVGPRPDYQRAVYDHYRYPYPWGV